MTGERARVRQLPRVLKRQDRRRTTGEHFWTEMLTPRHADDNPVMSMVAWLEHFEPGASSIKHAHQNEAIFYILEGSGYEIHEGQRYDWKAGDVVIVPGGSVHQHFDPSTEERASALVINPKPLFFFLNL